MVCQSIEGGTRARGLQQTGGGKFAEDLLSNISKTLKLTGVQTAAFAFALVQTSQYSSLRAEASRLLRSKLGDWGRLGGGSSSSGSGGSGSAAALAALAGANGVHEDTLYALANFVRASKVSSKYRQTDRQTR